MLHYTYKYTILIVCKKLKGPRKGYMSQLLLNFASPLSSNFRADYLLLGGRYQI